MKNVIQKPGYFLKVTPTHPASGIVSGDVFRWGSLIGIAVEDQATTVVGYFGPCVADVPVNADDGSASPVAIGDSIFWTDGDAIHLSKQADGYFCGFAMETISSGQSDTINVKFQGAPGYGVFAAGSLGTSELASSAVTAAKLASNAVETAKIADGQVTGSKIGVTTDAATTPGVPILFNVVVDGGAAANDDITINVPASTKFRVIDVWAVHTGGNGETSDTIQVKNGTNAITDAMSWAGNDQTIVRAASINDAYSDIADGGTLRVTTVDNDTQGDVGAGIVYVLGILLAA